MLVFIHMNRFYFEAAVGHAGLGLQKKIIKCDAAAAELELNV